MNAERASAEGRLTARQRETLATLARCGARGATFADLGITRGSNGLPALIFAGLAEYIPGSEPWRYRVKAIPVAQETGREGAETGTPPALGLPPVKSAWEGSA